MDSGMDSALFKAPQLPEQKSNDQMDLSFHSDSIGQLANNDRIYSPDLTSTPRKEDAGNYVDGVLDHYCSISMNKVCSN